MRQISHLTSKPLFKFSDCTCKYQIQFYFCLLITTSMNGMNGMNGTVLEMLILTSPKRIHFWLNQELNKCKCLFVHSFNKSLSSAHNLHLSLTGHSVCLIGVSGLSDRAYNTILFFFHLKCYGKCFHFLQREGYIKERMRQVEIMNLFYEETIGKDTPQVG